MSKDKSILDSYTMQKPKGFDEWSEDAKEEYLRLSYNSLNLSEKRQAIAEYYGDDLKSTGGFKSKTLTKLLFEVYDVDDLNSME